MRIVRAYQLGTATYAEYMVPSIAEALAHSKATHGKQYDPIERKNVEGGTALVWPRRPTTQGE